MYRYILVRTSPQIRLYFIARSQTASRSQVQSSHEFVLMKGWAVVSSCPHGWRLSWTERLCSVFLTWSCTGTGSAELEHPHVFTFFWVVRLEDSKGSALYSHMRLSFYSWKFISRKIANVLTRGCSAEGWIVRTLLCPYTWGCLLQLEVYPYGNSQCPHTRL